jgi:hypothetical protein
VVVAVLAAIIAFVMILMAYSTVNTPMSNDGDRATQSQWVDSEG